MEDFRKRLLHDHLAVGPHKPVSYLPLKTVETVLRLTISDYKAMIENAGNRCAIFGPGKSFLESGGAFAYSIPDLASVLGAHRDLLIANGWPLLPDEFVERIALEWVSEDHPIKPVIQVAFGDSPSH